MIINLPKLGNVRFDDNLTPDQLQAQLSALEQKYDFKLPKPEAGIGTLFKRGFMRGLGETGIALGDVLPAMGASALGFDDYAKRQMEEAATSRAELEREYPTQFKSYTEVGSPYEGLQYIAETLGELGPTALTAMIPGLGAGAVGTRLAGQGALRAAMAAGPVAPAAVAAAKQAGQVAGRRAMYGGVYLGSFAQNAPEVFESIYQETDKMEPGIAALAGGLSSVLDTLVPGNLLDKLGGYGKLKIVEQMAKESGAAPKVWKAIGKEALKSAGAEGLTEAAQESINITAEEIAGSLKGLSDPENIQRVKESFVKGAVGGSAFGTVGGVRRGLVERKEYRDRQALDEALAKLTAQGEVPQLSQEAPVGTQGEMFQPEKEAELARAAEMQGPQAPLPTDFKLEAQEAPRAEQLELDLPEPAPERDTRTRDMIDEMETADVTRMIDEGETAQIEALYAEDARKAEEARAESARQVEAAALEKERLKFESDIAELDGRLQAKQQKTTEDARLGVLLPIIENPEVQNIGPAFQAELRRQGFTDTAPTEREQNLIQRATDLRAAETAEPVAQELIPSAPAELAEMEAAVPERVEQREPQQLGFPGMGKPRGIAPEAAPEITAQPEPEYATVLTPEVLDKTGLPKQSGFYRALVNKDMADPAQQRQIADTLVRVRTNPNLTPATKQAIESVAMQAFGALAKQTEMFGPRGGVIPPSGTKERQREPSRRRDTDAADDGTGGGVGAGGAKATDQTQKAPASTQRTEAPESTGLGGAGQPTTVVRDGKVGKPTALKPKAAAKTEAKPAEKPKAAAKTKVPEPSYSEQVFAAYDKLPEEQREAVAKRLGLTRAQFIETEAAFKRTEEVDDAIAEVRKQQAKPAEKPKAEAKPAPKRTAAQGTYGEVAETEPETALSYLAFEIAHGMLGNHSQKKLNEISAGLENGVLLDKDVVFVDSWNTVSLSPMSRLRPGEPLFTSVTHIGGKYAKAFYNSLPTQEKNKLIGYIRKYLADDAKTVGERRSVADQEKTKAIEEKQMNEYKLPADQVVLMRPLHPMITDALKAGKLADALRMLAAQQQGRPSKIAQKLLDALGSTKVQVVEGLELDGKPVAGYFDPKTNTIKLDADKLVTHGLLHEVTHAAVSHVLSNKSHPVTKQLTELYNSVKDSLDTAYGAQSLDEFVSEAFSNPDFQTKLAAINPKGEPLSALQRFFTTVGNFIRRMLGMDTKAPGSALDTTDALVNQILSPAPETRSGEPLALAAMLNKGKDVIDGLAIRAQQAPMINPEWVARAHEFFTGGAPRAVKTIVRSALPLNALVDVAKKYIPMAQRLDDLVGLRSGAENIRNQKIVEPAIELASKWAKVNPKLVDTLNTVVYTSTIEEVDPSKPRAAYAKDAEKLKQWDALQKDWNALGSAGQTVYKHMRDTYKKMYEEIRSVLDSRIDAAVEDKDTAKKIKTEIYERLFASGRIEPYFPLTRTGRYWLSYVATDPRNGNREFYVEAFETSFARDQAVKELNADSSAKAEDIQKFTNPNQINYRKAPPTSFVNSVLRTLEANKIGATQEQKERINSATEEVMRLFLNTLPETSFAQSFRRRKGTLGFKQDALGALRTKTFSMSRQLSNMEYGAKLEKLRQDMRDYVRGKGNDETAVAYLDELEKRIDYAISPNIPTWSKLATSLGFNMTLGFNVSSALINMSQIPLVVMPYLGGKYGYSDTTKAIGRATRVFTNSGFNREVEMLVPTDKGEKKLKVRAFPSIDNYNFDAPENKNLKHLKTLVEVAGARGQLNRSQMYDVLDVDESNNLLTKLNAASGFVFHHGERMNRQVALIAAYELDLQKQLGAGKDLSTATEEQRQKAAQEAIYLTELTNGGTAAAAAPRIAQNSIGRVAFMYKRYGVSMYYMLFKTARDALKSQDADVRKAAKKQIAGIYASAALMAGAQGLPMYGVAAMLYNMFLRDKDEDDFDTAARKWMGELTYAGLGNAVFGVELASRFGLSDLLFRDTTTRPSDSVMLSLMEQMGGPVFGVANRMIRGGELISEGYGMRGLEQMLPSAAGNALKAIRFATEGANTLRGDPITGEIGPWNAFAQFFGFAPAEYVRQLEINSSGKNIEREVLENRTKLLRKYYIAMRQGDSEELSDIMQDMAKLSRRHPGVAITGETINRSMAQHMRTSATMYHGITINKKLRPELMRHFAEFDED